MSVKIYCTVKEFGQLVRGCEKSSCINCALNTICNGNEYAYNKPGIECLVSADSIVAEPEGVAAYEGVTPDEAN